MSENAMDGKDEIVNGEIEAERVRFENERMTRHGPTQVRLHGGHGGVFGADSGRFGARRVEETSGD